MWLAVSLEADHALGKLVGQTRGPSSSTSWRYCSVTRGSTSNSPSTEESRISGYIRVGGAHGQRADIDRDRSTRSFTNPHHAKSPSFNSCSRNDKSKEKIAQKLNSVAPILLGCVGGYAPHFGGWNKHRGRPLTLAAYPALLSTLWSLGEWYW